MAARVYRVVCRSGRNDLFSSKVGQNRSVAVHMSTRRLDIGLGYIYM